MSDSYAQIAFTDAVKAAQRQYGSRAAMARWEGMREGLREGPRGGPPSGPGHGDELTETEQAFIAERDDFYIASVSDSGWPYVQFRGGPRGFVTCPGPRQITWPDFRGNRQYITTGNLDHDGRIALIFMDYANQLRLKVFGTAVATDIRSDTAPGSTAGIGGYSARVERLVRVEVAAYDWNCPQHITPRFSVAQVHHVTAALERRIAQLDDEIRQLRREGAGGLE